MRTIKELIDFSHPLIRKGSPAAIVTGVFHIQFSVKGTTNKREFLLLNNELAADNVEPLRRPGSIYFRNGINENFEMFAMNHYTTFMNLVRAFDKIEQQLDDFKYAEEIWSNLQRAAEVAKKATDAFRTIYVMCTSAEPRINLAKLDNVIEMSLICAAPLSGAQKHSSSERGPVRAEMHNVLYHFTDFDFRAEWKMGEFHVDTFSLESWHTRLWNSCGKPFSGNERNQDNQLGARVRRKNSLARCIGYLKAAMTLSRLVVMGSDPNGTA